MQSFRRRGKWPGSLARRLAGVLSVSPPAPITGVALIRLDVFVGAVIDGITPQISIVQNNPQDPSPLRMIQPFAPRCVRKKPTRAHRRLVVPAARQGRHWVIGWEPECGSKFPISARDKVCP